MRSEETKNADLFKILVKQSSFNTAAANFAHQMALSVPQSIPEGANLRELIGKMIEAQESISKLIEAEFQAMQKSTGPSE